MSFHPTVSRCPETNALVFSTPVHILAEQERQVKRDQEHDGMKQLLSQLVLAQPKSVLSQVDPDLLALVQSE